MGSLVKYVCFNFARCLTIFVGRVPLLSSLKIVVVLPHQATVQSERPVLFQLFREVGLWVGTPFHPGTQSFAKGFALIQITPPSFKGERQEACHIWRPSSAVVDMVLSAFLWGNWVMWSCVPARGGWKAASPRLRNECPLFCAPGQHTRPFVKPKCRTLKLLATLLWTADSLGEWSSILLFIVLYPHTQKQTPKPHQPESNAYWMGECIDEGKSSALSSACRSLIYQLIQINWCLINVGLLPISFLLHILSLWKVKITTSQNLWNSNLRCLGNLRIETIIRTLEQHQFAPK